MGDEPPDGSRWIGPDGEEYARNPSRFVTASSRAMVTLWSYCRGGGMGGSGFLPEDAMRQPAVMLEAFALMSMWAQEFAPKR